MPAIEPEIRSFVNRQSVRAVSFNTGMETIGTRVRSLRNAAKGRDGRSPLSRDELAEAVGMAKTTLQTLEDKPQKATRYLGRLAGYFGVRAEWLETGTGSMRGTSSTSHSGRIDPVMLAEAEKLVGAREYLMQQKYPLDVRAQWLARVYEQMVLDGGRLTAEHQAALLGDKQAGGHRATEAKGRFSADNSGK